MVSSAYCSKRELVSLEHVYDLAHLWALLGIGIYAAEANQDGPLQCSWGGLHFHQWVHQFLCSSASHHTLEPLYEVYLKIHNKGMAITAESIRQTHWNEGFGRFTSPGGLL